jgi:hypothetical protein
MKGDVELASDRFCQYRALIEPALTPAQRVKGYRYDAGQVTSPRCQDFRAGPPQLTRKFLHPATLAPVLRPMQRGTNGSSIEKQRSCRDECCRPVDAIGAYCTWFRHETITAHTPGVAIRDTDQTPLALRAPPRTRPTTSAAGWREKPAFHAITKRH